MPRRIFASVLALASIGCADGVSTSHVTVRDSAGIEIVEHGAAALEAAPLWTLAAEPSLDLGVVEGAPEYMFFRVADGLRLDDGTIVVTDGGSREIRFYRADGTHIRTVGRRGEGPSEFGFPYHTWRHPGDSIAVYDMSLQRISIWSTAGDHGRVVRLDPAFVNEPELVGVLADGSLLLYDMVLFIPSTGFDTIRANVHRYSADGVARDTIATVPWGVMGHYEKASLVGGPAFQPRTVVAGTGVTIVIGRAAAYELTHLDTAKTVRRVVRWHDRDLAVTPADMDRHRSEELASATTDDRRRLTENILASQPESTTFPAYDELHFDAGGNLWVRTFRRPTDEGPTRYTIFDPEGRMIARAELPLDLRVFEIGSDYVLGATRDELDVEHVVMYDLRRDAPE